MFVKEISPDASINISVNDETTDLISRVADLQQEKWQLEERVSNSYRVFFKEKIGALVFFRIR